MRQAKGFWVVLLALGFAVISGGTASANVAVMQSYKKAYPGKAPKEYNCKVCHLDAIGKVDNLNAYGKAMVEQKGGMGKAKTMTAEDFKALEAGDADSDGATNGDELAAGTNPSDPESKPAPAQ